MTHFDPPAHLSGPGLELWRDLTAHGDAAEFDAVSRLRLTQVCESYALLRAAQDVIRTEGAVMKIEKLDPRTGAVVSTSQAARPEVRIIRDERAFVFEQLRLLRSTLRLTSAREREIGRVIDQQDARLLRAADLRPKLKTVK